MNSLLFVVSQNEFFVYNWRRVPSMSEPHGRTIEVGARSSQARLYFSLLTWNKKEIRKKNLQQNFADR